MVNIKDKDEFPTTSRNSPPTPRTIRRDPSLPASLQTFNKSDKVQGVVENKELSCRERFLKYLYNKNDKTYCGRTCKSWLCIIIYSAIYLISLAAYFLIFLYGTLMIMKEMIDYQIIDKVDLLTFTKNGIGISGTPTSESDNPLIWYKQGDEEDYKIYVDSIDRLLAKSRKKRDTGTLGPCGQSPFGYGNSPCVILKINKQMLWSAKPLSPYSNETNLAPKQVKNWIQKEKKFWYFCEGCSSFDREHMRLIRYYPDPPGVDPGLFPLNSSSPLVAIQLTNFTVNVSLAIECKLWYEGGPSSFSFVVYVTSDSKVVSRTIDSE